MRFYSWFKRSLKVDRWLEFAKREPFYYEHQARFNELISNGARLGRGGRAVLIFKRCFQFWIAIDYRQHRSAEITEAK